MNETELKEAQELHEEIKAEFTFDIDNLPPIQHRWVDRGEVMSCEGADHLNHRHFKSR
jgi:hypothetical protein